MGRLALRPALRAYAHAPAGAGEVLWTPADITTTLWLDANDASTITESGGAVSQWGDKSGNANHASQSTGSKQPALVGNTIDFSGGWEEHLETPSISGNTIYNQDLTVVYVSRASTTYTAHPSPLGTWDDGGSWWTYYKPSTLELGFHGAAQYWSGDLVSTSEDSIVVDVVSGTGATLDQYLDGTSVQSRSISHFTTSAGAKLRIGSAHSSYSSTHWPGTVSEIVLITSAISSGDRQRMEGYLAWKWDGGSAGVLVGKLPADHPYKSAAPLA